MTNEKLQKEFQELCDAVFDQTASDEQVQRLEEMVLADPQFKRQYAELSHLHASLAVLSDESIEPVRFPDQAQVIPSRRRPFRTFGAMAAAAVLLAVLFTTMFNQPQPAYATLVATDGCLWESSTVPIQTGVRIGTGRLRLAQGMASITFDSGARVDIEGPADFEVLAADRCQLDRGKLVTTVDENGKGFVVETPNAVLIDQGTSFGVQVQEDGESSVEVFEGRVDVEHRHNGQTTSLAQREAVRLSEREMVSVSASDVPVQSSGVEGRLLQITTATGGGRDHWLQRDESKRKGPEDLLLVKMAAPGYGSFSRKAFLRFDISGIETATLKTAALQLTVAPTGMGYSSRIPDATFRVLGIIDETMDHWTADELKWDDYADLLRNSKTPATLIGQFVVPQGQQTGSVSIEGVELLEFLTSDTNGFVTLVVASLTQERSSGALVHGFASGKHESLPPPTLRLRVEE